MRILFSITPFLQVLETWNLASKANFDVLISDFLFSEMPKLESLHQWAHSPMTK